MHRPLALVVAALVATAVSGQDAAIAKGNITLLQSTPPLTIYKVPGAVDATPLAVIDTLQPEAIARVESMASSMNTRVILIPAQQLQQMAGGNLTGKLAAILDMSGAGDKGNVIPVVGFGEGAPLSLGLAYESWPVVVTAVTDKPLLDYSHKGVRSTSKMLFISPVTPTSMLNVTDLERELDGAGIQWETIRLGGYNRQNYVPDRDMDMWPRVQAKITSFIRDGGSTVGSQSAGPSPMGTKGQIMNYTDGNDKLEGYVASPSSSGRHPAVIVVPDWTGADAYELERANLLALEGYVGIAANIYGGPMNFTIPTAGERRNLTTYWRSNWNLYIARIRAAINFARQLANVHPDKIAVIGYCFGGSGVLYEALDNSNVQAVVSFHGGLSEPRVNMSETIRELTPLLPYLSIQSGGSDETYDQIDWILQSLLRKPGRWDLTRYSGVGHGFTVWGSGGYHARADGRSWLAMKVELMNAFNNSTTFNKTSTALVVKPVNMTSYCPGQMGIQYILFAALFLAAMLA